MNIILLSGGSGKRLWPLSNDTRSKQFIRFFKSENGDYESMVKRIYRQIKAVDSNADITVATSLSQVSALLNQLGDSIGISVEPCRRDTFPAIALATAYLHDVKGIPDDEAVVVCPVDPYVDNTYFEFLKKLWSEAQYGTGNLTLIGIEPTYPSEKYGYIIPVSKQKVSSVSCFKEKPDEETAKKYIAEGALWNGGVFAYKIGYVLKKAHELIEFTDYYDLFSKYETLEKISFDYAVAEKEKDIRVLRYGGKWKDIGTWNTLTETMDDNIIGNAVMNERCKNVHIINELDIPVLAMGLRDVVISSSADGILVSDKHESSYIKPFVDKIDMPVMYAEKSWGSYRIINIEKGSHTIKVTLNKGHKMNYHSHKRRDEIWVVIEGRGRAVIDGKNREIESGDVIIMKSGSKHTVFADTKLKLIEVQLGNDINVEDKIKYEL